MLLAATGTERRTSQHSQVSCRTFGFSYSGLGIRVKGGSRLGDGTQRANPQKRAWLRRALCLRFPTSSTSASARWPGSARFRPTSCASGRASSRSSSPTREAPASASTAAATSRWRCASRRLLKEEGYTIPGARQVLKAEFRQKEPQLSLLGEPSHSRTEAKQLRTLRRELAAIATMLAQPIGKLRRQQKALPQLPPQAPPIACHAPLPRSSSRRTCPRKTPKSPSTRLPASPAAQPSGPQRRRGRSSAASTPCALAPTCDVR